MSELPQLAGLYKKYSDQGLHIIGLEAQNSGSSEITSLCKDKGVSFQVTTGGQLKGSSVRGIPHGFLFGADGKLAVDDPRGKQLEDKIKELLKDAGAALAGPGPYVKLAPLAAQIKAGTALGTVLKTLASKKDSKDADEAKEAQMMYEALRNGSNEMLESALSKKADDPVGSLAKLDKLAVQFTGDEVGTKAKTEADALRKDPKVKAEVEAEGMFKQIETLADSMKAVGGSKNPKNDAFRRTNAQTITSVVGGCQQIVQRYPGTGAAKKAEELMDQFR